MAREKSTGINVGDMVACYVPYDVMQHGYDIGVILNQYTRHNETYYRVDWIRGGYMLESERTILRNRNLYEKLMREHLYVEPI